MNALQSGHTKNTEDDRHLVVAGLVGFGDICGLVAICVWIAQEQESQNKKIKKETYNPRFPNQFYI